jgi:hypothetical protein
MIRTFFHQCIDSIFNSVFVLVEQKREATVNLSAVCTVEACKYEFLNFIKNYPPPHATNIHRNCNSSR